MNDIDGPQQEMTLHNSSPNEDGICRIENLWRDQLNRIKLQAEDKRLRKPLNRSAAGTVKAMEGGGKQC